MSERWATESTFLEFSSYNTPNTDESSCEVLLEIIRERVLELMMCSVTTANAADIIKSVESLRMMLYTCTCLDQYKVTGNFHFRCMAHVLKLDVKESMKMIHEKLTKIRTLQNLIRSAVMSRDQFFDVGVQTKRNFELLRLVPREEDSKDMRFRAVEQ